MEKKHTRELSPDEMDQVTGGEDGSKEMTAKDLVELKKEIEEINKTIPHYNAREPQPAPQPVKITKK